MKKNTIFFIAFCPQRHEDKSMKKNISKIIKYILLALAIIIALIACYALYILISYDRIPDKSEISIENPSENILSQGEKYTIATYNIGFGAYGPEYSFFMDTGYMADGTYVQGKYGKGISKDLTIRNTEGAISELKELNTDMIILQEVDVKSSRAYKVNQYNLVKDSLSSYSSSYASNFHTPYLPYPFNDMHGKTEAGLVTLSKYKINSVERRSYPIADDLSKLFDLDRCFTVSRLAVDNGKELVLINSHMSAYDKGGIIRASQLELLTSVMSEEYNNGNYVVVGGDFNHILSEEMVGHFESGQLTPSWIAVLSDEDIPSGFAIAKAQNREEVSTCRSADIPYEKGVNYTAVIDGFIVSDNIEFSAINIETDYAWSDHQPVVLTITLK